MSMGEEYDKVTTLGRVVAVAHGDGERKGKRCSG